MPSDPESIPELARMFVGLERTIERRFASLETMLQGYVSTQVHQAYERRTDERVADLQKQVNKEITAREKAIAEMRRTQRWVVAAVIIPSVAVTATIIAIIVGRL